MNRVVMQKKAVILFSGGLDSTTCLAMAKDQGFIPYTLSFSYDQKHKYELDAASRIAKQSGSAEHKVVSLSLGLLGGSALTDTNIEVPDYQDNGDIPVTYVPARNTIFLSIALAWAEVLNAFDIFIGINAVDYSGYPDCRPEYLKAFEGLSNLATKAGVEGGEYKIHAPLLSLHKSEIILAGMGLGVDYSQTTSCYRLDAEGRACGSCDSCFHRKLGFKQAGVEDPTRYQ
jgi:7-cyano-7-deazaguanine synthase